jgi:integrase
MPRKSSLDFKHVKSVKRNGQTYLYFNTGEKIDEKPVYVALGKKGDIDVGARYSVALAARTRRGGNPTSLTVPQLSMRFQRAPDYTKKSNSTQRTYAVYLNRLSSEFNNAPAGDLDSSDIYELLDEMESRPAAIDMLLLAGGQMYEWAKKRKLVHHNPFEGIDRASWEAQQYEPWPDEVIEEALADPRLELPVALMYFTAQRIGDCCSMRWSDIRDGVICVRQRKTGKFLEIPIHKRLAAVLDKTPRRGETILADAKGRRAKDQTIRSWVRIFGEARGLKLVPHGLRKNAVNALLEADCSTGETSAISGQSLRMVEHYARKRNSPKMGRRAMRKWERAANRETDGKISSDVADL